MGNKVATVLFWLLAAVLTIFGLRLVLGEMVNGFNGWQVTSAAFAVVVLVLGWRQCLRALRRKDVDSE
ncbi:hypothetical protein DVT68_20175 [Dyella solisilvae]|uniref:Uncharacterized protein n=1 Tax=Dyella solisilvae TaxID=1920168 RepID=A0A370K280_9GAMM|nr:hypothetical protein [Dyella solisilvae]RDI96775.1 hypothetical protein DVT68_20175 [Dyella solisilvae]